MSEQPNEAVGGCDQCRDVVERPDVPHVVRKCAGCGREMHVVEPGPHGKGIQIRAGDRFVFPPEWLNLSFNPLKNRGQVSKSGLDWFAKHVFLDGLLGKEDSFAEDAAGLEKRMDEAVNASPLVHPYDIHNPDHHQAILDALGQRSDTPAFWSMWTGVFLGMAREAREDGNVNRAMWATACAERCRMMLLYKEHLEEVVWMGQSAKRLVDALQTWDGHRGNADEEFWQQTFGEHSYVLSQVFAVPVVFIQEKAFVGGMKLDRTDAKFVDYLFSAESSKEAILVEIKTPTARLLGAA